MVKKAVVLKDQSDIRILCDLLIYYKKKMFAFVFCLSVMTMVTLLGPDEAKTAST